MSTEKLFSIKRRTLLSASLAAGASAALPSFAAAAEDVISQAKIIPSKTMTQGAHFKKTGKLRIGFSNGFSGNTWRTECIASLKLEAAQHPDIADLIIVDGQGSITKQVNDIGDLMTQEVDAILCIANSGTAVAPALAQATRRGIVTVPFNLPVSGDHWSAYIGTNPTNKGKALGQFLNTALNGKGKIVALGGLPGNSYTAAAWAGSKSVFGSGIEVLAFRPAYWQQAKAKIVMADLLSAYPQIDGLWCDGGQDTVGAAQAMLAAGRPLVPSTGDDYNGLLKLYAKVQASQPNFKIGIVAEPTWESVIALRTALDLLAGKNVPKVQTIVPPVITGANYKQFIKPDLPDGVYVDTTLSTDELKKLFH